MESENKVIARLEEQERKEGGLSPLLIFYKKLLLIQGEAIRSLDEPRLKSLEKARERMKQGLPMLDFDELEIDPALLNDTFEKVKSLFMESPELFGRTGGDINKTPITLNREIARAWFDGSLSDGTDNYLRESIIHASLSPFWAGYSRALMKQVDQGRWRQGKCPVCGGRPDFAFLDKESGARWLVCSRCDAEWRFQRLECPYCGSTDQNNLAYYTDEEGLYRLYVCEKCKRYLKTIDLRQAKDEVLFPLERLLTFSIDLQAKEYGFNPYWVGDDRCGG